MPLEKDYLLLERYKIHDILGQGGMGAVYRAIDENLGVEVAVKENLFTSDEYIRQFRREATILASLKHANLPRVFDHFEIENKGQYLVMDYIEGEDIRQRMDRVGVLPEEEVVLVGASICDALQYLHTRQPPIYHRDIKPGNIKINPEGVVYLVDFGLAKVASGGEATTTGARAMTPGYSSPEQYGTARTDSRSDVYSLGATMYAILSASIPEDGLARAMEQSDLTDLRKHNPKVSRRLATIIERALSIHPDDRYQSAEELKSNLLSSRTISRKMIVGGNTELTIPPPPTDVIEAVAEGKIQSSQLLSQTQVDMSGESLKRIKRRKRQRVLRTLGIILVVTIAGFAIWFGSGGFEDVQAYLDSIEQPPATSNSIVDESDKSTPTAITIEATVTPTFEPTATVVQISGVTSTPTPTQLVGLVNGEVITFASDRSGSVQIWNYDVGRNYLNKLTEIEGGACQPAWHPDGIRLAFISPCDINKDIYLDSKIFLLDTNTQEIIRLVVEEGSFDPDWSPDGTKLVYVKAESITETQIMLLNVVNNEVSEVTPLVKLNINPDWSPDGKNIVFTTSNSETSQIRLSIISSDLQGEPVSLTRSQTFTNYSPAWSPDGEKIVFSQQESEEGSVRFLNWVSLDVLDKEINEYEEFRVASDIVVPETEPSVSPDGLWIAFESWPEGENHDIYVIHWDGVGRIRITDYPGFEFDPTWKPLNGE